MLIRVAIFVCFLIAAAPCFAQANTEVIYTGKLMGYFRSPDKQPWDQPPGCKPAKESKDSPAAVKFQELRNAKPHAVLVTAGDNFAPELEARVFDPKPAPGTVGVPSNQYASGNKELYYWNQIPGKPGEWVYHADLKNHPDLEAQLALGNATIPTDNVGCFLAINHFAAIVPGKHDFYFGVERVRALARFMAGLTRTDFAVDMGKDYQPPQMLGANLVIKTLRTVTPSLTAKSKSKWPDGSSIKVGDGKSVYPWFSSKVAGRISPPESIPVQEALNTWFGTAGKPGLDDLIAYVDTQAKTMGPLQDEWQKFLKVVAGLKVIKVCPTNDVNEVAATCPDGWPVGKQGLTVDGKDITYSLTIPPNPKNPWANDKKVAVLDPGRNYGLCQVTNKSAAEGIETNCQTFSVYRPFLNFPRLASATGTNYTDPDPFVLIPNADHPKEEVAIFGVVDPNITQYIGVLNYAWKNEDNGLKSVLSVEDPAEALREQLDYFDSWYKAKTNGHTFAGLKILLAQMSPQMAKTLAARLNRFQLVVTEANEELGTSETTQSTEWNQDKRSSAFIAVPVPYPANKKNVEGYVHFGMISAESTAGGAWKLNSQTTDAAEIKGKYKPDKDLALTLLPALQECVDPKIYSDAESDLKSAQPKMKAEEVIRLAALCAMRERLSADVALIQKRDRFDRVPAELNDVQQILDHLIWKGDLVTLLYVPGSAIKKSLDLSRKYADEDSNNLSLADEKNRGLEFIGITNRGKDILINESPLDDKKIYTVATTDYIAGGDTGYPDLAATALDPKTRPSQYPQQLELISSLVCRRINPIDPATKVQQCISPTPLETYLDAIMVNAGPSSRPAGFGSKLWELFPFKLGDKDQKQTTLAGDGNQRVQQRGFWILSLKNFGVTFNGLSNNLSDSQIATDFAGVKTSGVTAKHAQTISSALDLRLLHTSHTGGPFIQTTIDYKRQSTGDVAPKISQITNLVTGEAGYLRNLRGGRSDKSMGVSISLYSETQLQKPFSTFTLGTGESLKIDQDRSLMLLPRAGLFWRNGTTNAFAAGLQYGRELNALAGYRFISPAGTFECRPDVAQTFADCIKKLSGKTDTKVTINSDASPILDSRPRAGFYWKSGFTLPINSKMSYVFTDKGDFFFNFSNDNATDTRYRDESKHSLKFTIWPSFSIGPSLRLLLYKNKVNRDFLFQKEFGFETSFAFDLFNRREKEVQIKHKP
jgi:hypothetical protein